MSLSPNDLHNFGSVQKCRVIRMKDYLKSTRESLKHAILKARLEMDEVNVELTTTKMHYGGRRYWFVCPKCGRRAGILFIEQKRVSCLQCKV